MTSAELKKLVDSVAKRQISMYGKDFLTTWEKTNDEILATFEVAQALRACRDANISTRLWDSGLAVSNFRDNSTRTRFSFASACDLLGLYVQDLDEGKSQIAHGETVRETAAMISFLSEAIGIRDDMYLGEGDRYQREVAAALHAAVAEGTLTDRPTVVNLQSDLDHPTQTMADFLHLSRYYGGIEKLRGKKLVMSWAYSPSYGKPLSVPQGVIAMAARFGMHVVLAHPEGYELVPETLDIADRLANEAGGSFVMFNSMEDAFKDADIVYPKSWAPFDVMKRRVPLLHSGDQVGLRELERTCLTNNSRYTSWECDDRKMKLTKKGKALYMHCLPADISGVSCIAGEVSASVFNRYRVDTYREAGWKPYIIAAMILLGKRRDPAATVRAIIDRAAPRVLGA